MLLRAIEPLRGLYLFSVEYVACVGNHENVLKTMRKMLYHKPDLVIIFVF